MSDSTTDLVTPAKEVLSLVKALNLSKTRVASVNGEIGERIKHAVENKHLHSSALKAVAKLVRTDPEKRDDFLRAYRLYFDYAQEAGMFGSAHVGDLVDEAESDADPAEAERLGDVVESNVRKLRRGIKTFDDSDFDEPAASSEEVATA